LQGEKVHFMHLSKVKEPSKSKWKERRVFLELDERGLDVLTYTDNSLLKKKRALLQLTALSSVDVLLPGDMSPASSAPQQPFMLKVEGETVDNKTSIAVFAFSDENTRDAWQSRLQQAIHLICYKSKTLNVCSPRLQDWRAESAFMKRRVYFANGCCSIMTLIRIALG